MDENTKNGLWNFYINKYNTEGSISITDEYDEPYKKSPRKTCSEMFFKTYLDAQKGNGIYNFEERSQYSPPKPVPIEYDINNPDEDAIRCILGFGIHPIDLLYRPCCKEIDDMVYS
ncbi:hypothetical protein Tco_1256374 [Tanacetum coccineum]